MAGMSQAEIDLLVLRYIGTDGGYLCGFSYAEHESFYVNYCDLMGIDVAEKRSAYGGTTKKAFIGILKEASPADQARIVRGVLAKFPSDDFTGADAGRRLEAGRRLAAIADRLEGGIVPNTAPAQTTETVQRALADAEALLKTSGPTSAVDRIHTALHGHLRHLCAEAGLPIASSDATTTQLITVLVNGHPQLQLPEPRRQDIRTILRTASTIVDAIGTIRNRASLAHPNEELIGEDEAWLVINVARSLFQYLDRRLQQRSAEMALRL
jgi:hypothetical protein